MFKCRACGYEELVPDFIIDESFVLEEFAENGSPIVLCPKCDGDIVDLTDLEKEYFKHGSDAKPLDIEAALNNYNEKNGTNYSYDVQKYL